MIIRADARSIPLKDNFVQTCVTSPPYWGLRDYQTARWEGGDANCEHKGRENPHVEASGLGGGKATTGHQHEGFRNFCPRCGARRIDRQIGLEATPDEYVATMVAVFREVRRVLRDDGTCWLNLGDSYSGSGKGGNPEPGKQATNHGSESIGTLYGKTGERARQSAVTNVSRRLCAEHGLKPKDLLMMPARVALALQADGWWLRSDIIWAKPNPMPESATDRPTRSHEYIFLLSKSERYFYDREAIAEPLAASSIERVMQPNFANQNGGPKDYGGNRSARKGLENLAAKIRTSGDYGHGAGRNDGDNHPSGGFPAPAMRNKRDVWTVNSEPTPEAHFATFPRKLIEPCILAGTSERGCCSECGAPRVRMTEPTGHVNRREAAHVPGNSATKVDSTGWKPTRVATDNWRPSCGHDAPTVPCLVLDPFIGSGTTGIVAEQFGRRWIGLDLSETYLSQIARKRTAQMGLAL